VETIVVGSSLVKSAALGQLAVHAPASRRPRAAIGARSIKKMQMIVGVEMTLMLAPFFATWMANGDL
jgi:hypothetical protein